jgi:hypothetical protein
MNELKQVNTNPDPVTRAPKKNIVALGKIAMQQLTGGAVSIMSIRGGPVRGYYNDKDEWQQNDEGDVNILPTMHPDYVIHARRYTSTLRADIGKGVRLFSGTLGWKDPEMVFNPSPSVLREFLFDPAIEFHAVDVETTYADQLIADLNCIGFGTATKAMCVGVKSRHGEHRFYTDGLQIQKKCGLRL